MENIGTKLKNRREELGYTLEEMSAKTKIQPHYLKALEEGNIDFFKDDLSYLRYFLRFYCQALQIDFEDVRENFENTLDEFNETQTLMKIQNRETQQKTIKKRISESRDVLKPEKRKIDYSLISLILVILFVIGAIAVFAIKLGPSLFNHPVNEVPVVTPLPSETPNSSEEPTSSQAPIVESHPLEITSIDGLTYEVRGWKENDQIAIRVEFGSDTWMRVSYNGTVTENPVSKTYTSGETMEILKQAENNLDITVHFGLLRGNKVFINNEEYVLDENVRDLVRGQQIHFILKGE